MMATRETKLQRGRRRGTSLARQVLGELRLARVAGGVSQRALARELGLSQPEICRLESNETSDVSVVRLCEIASLLGLEPSITLHPLGDPLRDRGQQRLMERFRTLLAAAWRAITEMPLPGTGDLRAWDLFLRIGDYRVGVELETRIRDIQALVRRVRQRERDGGVDHILIVLSDSATNRRLVGQLRESLGPAYQVSPRALLRALRDGVPLSGSGVVLV
jgi:transcriptional regulator with XRE-family HTH domain